MTELWFILQLENSVIWIPIWIFIDKRNSFTQKFHFYSWQYFFLFSWSSSSLFSSLPNIPKCVDANECSSNPCGRGARCINQLGGYTCECLPNSEGDPYDRTRGCTSNNIPPQGKITQKIRFVIFYETLTMTLKTHLFVFYKIWNNLWRKMN